MSREAAEVARRAAEIQQQRGHCKGGIQDAEGRVCMWGALIAAACERETGYHFYQMGLPQDLYVTLTRELRALGYDDNQFYPGAGFNDLPETDERDVAKVLLQVADRLDIGGES